MSESEREQQALARKRAWAQRIIDGQEPHDAASIAHSLEDEIERRGLQRMYLDALIDSTAPILESDQWELWMDQNYDALWSFLRATSEQRARAFLEAVKQGE